MHPSRDRAQFILLVPIPSTFGRSLRLFDAVHQNHLMNLIPFPELGGGRGGVNASFSMTALSLDRPQALNANNFHHGVSRQTPGFQHDILELPARRTRLLQALGGETVLRIDPIFHARYYPPGHVWLALAV